MSHMDSQLPQENLAEKQETSPIVSTKENSNSPKNEQKIQTRSKRRRSRSQTPQTKADDSKTLQITLTKLDEEFTVTEAIHENGNPKENGSKESSIENKVFEDEDKNDIDVETIVIDEEVEVQEEKGVASEKESPEKVVSPKKAASTKKGKTSRQDKNDIDVETIVIDEEVEVQEEKGVASEKESPEKVVSPKKAASTKKGKTSKQPVDQVVDPQDSVEMEPLVISDEPDPELQFDENSDLESGKGSPVISRCNTRRSQTRNIPTPKTPKLAEPDQQLENETTEEPKLEAPKVETNSSDVIDTTYSSTKAEVGGDCTRLDYMEKNNSVPEDSSYLNVVRERSMTETLRGLSSRRPIRNDYRRLVFQNAHERSDSNMQNHDSIENVRTGVKRKDRSVTPEETKKFKGDVSGLFSSPFSNFRNKFKSELPSSTPKLLGYKDNRSGMQYEEGIATDRNAGEKSWCAIM